MKTLVDYRINYQRLCYLMRQITKDLNSAGVFKTRGGTDLERGYGDVRP